MIRYSRIDLEVPYAEKEDAKAAGARWDRMNQTWYAPPGANLVPLLRWLPSGVTEQQEFEFAPAPSELEKGVELTELLARVKGAIDQALPAPVWVRAEISELRGKNGHLYLTLVQRNEQGDILAQTRAIIWKNRAVDISATFEEATGAGLKADIKILCLASVRFDILYGLSLIIEDVDPAFTLGDLAAKLARVREELKRAGLYDRNQQLPAPVDYVRVAVISPETSAGLGDFRRETDRLQRADLCDFHFFEATFQGSDAPFSLRQAIQAALAAHRQARFDALVIIRGGGSVTDLAWLNDLELARLVCNAPCPVITGIGHQRDSTILDEIAHRRFDTPSKVALHITSTIRDNAFGAIQALQRIEALVGRIIIREKTMVQAQADRIEAGVRSVLAAIASAQHAFAAVIQTTAQSQLRETTQALAAAWNSTRTESERAARDASLGLARSGEAVTDRLEMHLEFQRSALQRQAQTVTLKTQGHVAAAKRETDFLRALVASGIGRTVARARDETQRARESVVVDARKLASSARRDIENLARIVVGLGPEATLQRGFTIARDLAYRPLTSRQAAMRNASFQVQFQDGNVAVINKDFAEEAADERQPQSG